MFELPTTEIGGDLLYATGFGDIVEYFTVYTTLLLVFAVVFTLLAVFARPERQVDIAFGGDAFYTKDIQKDDLRFQRFIAIACGIATMGALISGDVFNFTLFCAMIGITNIGIVASYRNKYVLETAYEYGIVAMTATVPLFGAAAIILATTGTLSMWVLFTEAVTVPLIAKILLLVGVMGEGMAPFFIGKAEITRAPGAPYVLMIHVSSLLIFLRVVEILLSM